MVILPESCRMPLSASDEEWAARIASYTDIEIDRQAALRPVQDAGYDINVETEKITRMYLDWAKAGRG